MMISFVSVTTAALFLFMTGRRLVSCFAPNPSFATTRKPTRLFLEDWVADMIDGELHRQAHKKEYEQQWMEKNRGAILHQLNKGGAGDDSNGSGDSSLATLEDQEATFRQQLKDKRLAESNPAQYCADRCIATGNCDVYEDIFKFTPQEVMEFCSDCVLATGQDEDEADECEIPEAFWEMDSVKP